MTRTLKACGIIKGRKWPMHCNFVVSVWGFSSHALKALVLKSWYYTTFTTFYVIAFLLHIRITMLLLLRYIICFLFVGFFFLFFFFHSDYVSFCYTLPDIFLSLSVSPPFNFPLLCFLLFTHTTCLFSFSNHIVSFYLCYFQFFHSRPPYLTKG